MSTMTRQAPRDNGVVLFSAHQIALELTPKFTFKKNESGATVLLVQDVAVFRSGTFADSMGYISTWEVIHLDQMVSYFDMLKKRNIFPDVPVRDGHSGFLFGGTEGNGKVVGYHTGLHTEERTSLHDGKSYVYLVAEYEIIDPIAQQNVHSKLWRSMSAEVGTYVTNDGAEFTPVYMGVAYVDIPAVEGLKGFSQGTNHKRYIHEEESVPNATTIQPPEVPPVPAVPPVQTHSEPPPPASFTFRIGDNETSDFAAVQSYVAGLEGEITALRQFRTETIEAGRTGFVANLASTGRILASQLDSTTAFAQLLNDEQFTAWRLTMESAPAVGILGSYGTGSGGDPTGTGAVDAARDHTDILRNIIKQHQRAGMPVDKIKATKSYKELVTIDSTFTL